MIGLAPSYSLSAATDVSAGYSLPVCYRCSVSPSFTSFLKEFTVTALPLNCDIALEDNSFVPATLIYNSAGSSSVVAVDYKTIFSHHSITDCPLNTCAVYEPDCLTPLAY